MGWKFRLSTKAKKQLAKLDKTTATQLLKGLKTIEDSPNPRTHGKPLKGNHKGFWRYRIGDYRILCEIQDEELIILALQIGHRKEIYR